MKLTIPAIAAVQSNKECYICKVSFQQLVKLFQFVTEDIPIEQRAQRTIQSSRCGDIAEYILSNFEKKTPYIIPPIVASLDSKEINFIKQHGEIGQLEFDLESSRLLINDGQHRRKGIEEAVKFCEEIADEQVAIWLIPDSNLESAQQIFADINRNAHAVSKSLTLLYDHRCLMATITRTVANKVEFFARFLEVEKTMIGTSKIFLLCSLNQANEIILAEQKLTPESLPTIEKQLVEFWDAVSQILPEWERILNCELTGKKRKRAITTIKKTTISFSPLLLFAIANLVSEHPELLTNSINRIKNWENLNLGKENSELFNIEILIEQSNGKIKVNRSSAAKKSLANYLFSNL